MQERVIRAKYDDDSITVYQAFRKEIAESAIANQTFISPPFKIERMTWIKPSFLWMMYRSGWASKNGQEYILSIKIRRENFEWALNHSCLSHFDPTIHSSIEEWRHLISISPVRIQWDPERDLYLRPQIYRSLQVGLSGIAVQEYIHRWILQIEDVSDRCRHVKRLIKEGKPQQANNSIPVEKPYHLPEVIKNKIGIRDRHN